MNPQNSMLHGNVKEKYVGGLINNNLVYRLLMIKFEFLECKLCNSLIISIVVLKAAFRQILSYGMM